MKRTIIRFKEKSKSLRGCAGVYYKEIPKILTRYYFRKLARKGCWDIEIIEGDNLYEQVLEDIDNHIPHID